MNLIDFESHGFPSSPPPKKGSLSISMAKLCWASITVGRPNRASLMKHGPFSKHEVLYRWNMVRAALDMSAPDKRFKNSELFNALDPTEKGGINFYLGMIFAKIAAQDLLSIPFLIHYKWMTENHSVPLTTGASSPDLLGLNPITGRWSVFEAKGRNSPFSYALMQKAKSQACNVTTVDGVNCDLFVATQLYRDENKKLFFRWDDPEPTDEEPRELETNKAMWRQYYGLAYALYVEQRSTEGTSARELGFKVDLVPEALDFIQSLNPRRDHRKAFKRLQIWSRRQLEQPEEGWFGDGVGLTVYDE